AVDGCNQTVERLKGMPKGPAREVHSSKRFAELVGNFPGGRGADERLGFLSHGVSLGRFRMPGEDFEIFTLPQWKVRPVKQSAAWAKLLRIPYQYRLTPKRALRAGH